MATHKIRGYCHLAAVVKCMWRARPRARPNTLQRPSLSVVSSAPSRPQKQYRICPMPAPHNTPGGGMPRPSIGAGPAHSTDLLRSAVALGTVMEHAPAQPARRSGHCDLQATPLLPCWRLIVDMVDSTLTTRRCARSQAVCPKPPRSIVRPSSVRKDSIRWSPPCNQSGGGALSSSAHRNPSGSSRGYA